MSYIIRRDDVPVKIIFDNIAYDIDPEDFRTNAEPLTSEVFKRDSVEFHKFLKALTQRTKDWKWIEKSKGVRDIIKVLRENYYGSDKGERHMNITEADLKEIYFKLQDVFPFEKYVNKLK